MSSTIWSIIPPVIAIVLALITKEVYMSLIIGILSGALLYTQFNLISTVETTFQIMGDKIGGNVDILIFLVLLGILVALITKSGASKAYGEWASRSIKSKKGALLATSALGVLIFVDDYFNCLTVGTVMRPVTDRYKITRAKLAYIIDATAAPVCIIAPISSWAAAVGSSLPETSTLDGFSLFLQTIPFNYYALFTLAFVAFMIFTGIDYGKMKEVEDSGEIGIEESAKEETMEVGSKGKVVDLILPIVLLIVSCIAMMLYTGGIMDGVGIITAFADCSSARALVMGSFITLVFTFLFYVPRKVITFKEFCDCFVTGFKAMTSAVMILCLAWTLSGICSADYLDIGGFVSSIINGNVMIGMLLPLLFFVVSLGLGFATGTSWGTFGILIPIALAIFGDASPVIPLAVAAILSGAVCGDHISPISDTTILSSAGAQCQHIQHVSTQIPYALTVCIPCCVAFLVGGIAQSGVIGLVAGLITLLIVFAVLLMMSKKAKA